MLGPQPKMFSTFRLVDMFDERAGYEPFIGPKDKEGYPKDVLIRMPFDDLSPDIFRPRGFINRTKEFFYDYFVLNKMEREAKFTTRLIKYQKFMNENFSNYGPKFTNETELFNESMIWKL